MSKKNSIKILVVAYLLGIALWFCGALFQCAQDAILKASGKMQTVTISSFDEFVQNDMQMVSDNKAVSTSQDPWFIVPINGKVRSVEIDFSFSSHPGEVNIYYTKQNEDFTDTQKVWGAAQNGGKYKFVLNGTQINNLRIDPCTYPNMQIELKSLVINPQNALGVYFALTGETVFYLLVYPGLLASILLSVLTWLDPTFTKSKALSKKIKQYLPFIKK